MQPESIFSLGYLSKHLFALASVCLELDFLKDSTEEDTKTLASKSAKSSAVADGEHFPMVCVALRRARGVGIWVEGVPRVEETSMESTTIAWNERVPVCLHHASPEEGLTEP